MLYLGFAFPPGVAALHPGRNPAGHALETQLVAQLREYFDVRSSGVLPLVAPTLPEANPDSGIAHELLLLEKAPELFHRFRSLCRLKAQYRSWRASGWEPEVVLVYNLSPIYNHFLLWLKRQPHCPKLVLLLLDSANLGQPISWLKSLRRRLKPMYVPDAEMLSCFDAGVGLSRTVEKYFKPRRIPFLWMPGACAPERAPRQFEDLASGRNGGPLRLGYFGSLGSHAGVQPLVRTLSASALPMTLDICGYGKMGPQLSLVAEQDPRIRFRGLLTPDQCLEFGQTCDLLINPRPASHGNENNFPSKLFDYALTGRAILTSRLSGVESVLGPEAFYFEPHDFDRALRRKLTQLSGVSRSDLARRGKAIQQRVLDEFSWAKQGGRLAQFLQQVCARHVAPAVESLEALAA